jgi:mRNA interferase RelE/StbE
MFEVILSPEAMDFYRACDGPLARKLARCFTHLELDPRTGGNIKQLRGEWAGYRRYRVGDWRVLYRIDDLFQRVSVVLIAHRREVYE